MATTGAVWQCTAIDVRSSGWRGGIHAFRLPCYMLWLTPLLACVRRGATSPSLRSAHAVTAYAA